MVLVVKFLLNFFQVERCIDFLVRNLKRLLGYMTKQNGQENPATSLLLKLALQPTEIVPSIDLEAIAFLKHFTAPLNQEENEMVRQALINEGDPGQVVIRYKTDTVSRGSMWSLCPGNDLTDEVIHCFFAMLASRDALLVSSSPDPSKKRCHFFKSFFITNLLDEKCSQKYTYPNVKTWSKNVWGKDVFGLSKIFIPVNMSNSHWACVVIFMQERKIQYFDSLGFDGMVYMSALLQYLKDEWADKNQGQELPDASEWRLIRCTTDTPKQGNGFDCGIFTCMFAAFLVNDYPLIFNQKDMKHCRDRIALYLLQGQVLGPQ